MSLIGVRLPAVQAHAVFNRFHQILFTMLVMAEKFRSVGMAKRQRPPLLLLTQSFHFKGQLAAIGYQF